MPTIFVNKIIDSEFNSAEDLKELFSSHLYNGFVLGVKCEDKLATVEQKRPIRGVCGWRISYGVYDGKGYCLESKAKNPNKFKQTVLCSADYKVEIL